MILKSEYTSCINIILSRVHSRRKEEHQENESVQEYYQLTEKIKPTSKKYPELVGVCGAFLYAAYSSVVLYFDLNQAISHHPKGVKF
jgi:hypothetical protein